VLRIADLVDDDSSKRDRVSAALKDPAQKNNRDHVDIIIALGMAKEGFDWVWCEHALTVGYRSSLTEIVQIIGRATRDAPGKRATATPVAIAANLLLRPCSYAVDETSTPLMKTPPLAFGSPSLIITVEALYQSPAATKPKMAAPHISIW
jgi:superfamily II DNA or RNA helicase